MASKEFLLENALIDDGPPRIYQLRLSVKNLDGVGEEHSRLRRSTVGKKDPSKPNKTILLVGETGSGKSSFINTILNYVMGVKIEDEEWYQIVDDTKKDSTESQTSKVSVYEIFGFEGKTLPYSLTIIDTPGYGDTRGIHHDAIITHKLHDLFRSEDGVHEIDAVCVVIKASENRLSDRLMYIYDSVVSLFGKDLEKNIVALITHSDGMPPTNALQALKAANIKCAKDQKDQPVYFKFNNCLSTKITEDTEFALKQAWELTMMGMKNFTDFLEMIAPHKLEITVDVLNERVRLAACINNLQDRVELIELKQTEIQQTQEGLEKHTEEMKTRKDFTIEVDEPYKVKEKIEGGMRGLFYEGAVSCNVCEETCHSPGCTIAWYPKHCEVMRQGRCTVCTNKCPASDHVKEEWRYVNKTRKVKKTLESLKTKYETEQKSIENLLSKLQIEKEKLDKEKNDLLEEAYQHVLNLEKIALNARSLSTCVYLDFLIEEMKKKGEGEKVQKLEDMKSRVDKGLLAGLQYMVVVGGAKLKNLVKWFEK